MVKKVVLLLLAVFMAFTVLIGCQQDEPEQDMTAPPETDDPVTQPDDPADDPFDDDEDPFDDEDPLNDEPAPAS